METNSYAYSLQILGSHFTKQEATFGSDDPIIPQIPFTCAMVTEQGASSQICLGPDGKVWHSKEYLGLNQWLNPLAATYTQYSTWVNDIAASHLFQFSSFPKIERLNWYILSCLTFLSLSIRGGK